MRISVPGVDQAALSLYRFISEEHSDLTDGLCIVLKNRNVNSEDAPAEMLKHVRQISLPALTALQTEVAKAARNRHIRFYYGSLTARQLYQFLNHIYPDRSFGFAALDETV